MCITTSKDSTKDIYVYTSKDKVGWSSVHKFFSVNSWESDMKLMGIISPWEFSSWME